MTDVFFYGLFMDDQVLRAKGVLPRSPRKASVAGYRLTIGRRAALATDPASRAVGMVFALEEGEIASLYAEPGLAEYRPQAILADFEDGTSSQVTTFNLADPAAAGPYDPDYAARLGAVLERLGLR